MLLSETVLLYMENPPDRESLQAVSARIGRAINARITVITAYGPVLADTWEDPKVMENHADRPEVRQALAEGLGRSTASAQTVGQEMLYTAVPIKSERGILGVARVAVPTSVVNSDLNRIISTIICSSLLAAAFSIGLGFYLARRTSRPVRSLTEGARRLAGGELGHRVRSSTGDETQELAEAFNTMASSLREIIQHLSEERGKLSVVLETMTDGVMVLDRDERVTLCNPAARRLLHITEPEADGRRPMEGAHGGWVGAGNEMSLQWNWSYSEMRQMVEDCKSRRKQQQRDFEFVRPRRVISAIATSLGEAGASGVLLTLHDLTRIRQMETRIKS